jgi:hypothetical protein
MKTPFLLFADYNIEIVGSTAPCLLEPYLYSDASVGIRQIIIPLKEVHNSNFRQIEFSEKILQLHR